MGIEKVSDLLAELRWSEDQIITNYSGERVWLKSIKGGVTDCCLADAPCDYHKRLTHVSSGSKQ